MGWQFGKTKKGAKFTKPYRTNLLISSFKSSTLKFISKPIDILANFI